MTSSMIIISSSNGSEDDISSKQSVRSSSCMSTQSNIIDSFKLNSKNGSRVSSASTHFSNGLLQNLTPEATHITTNCHLNSFNRPVTSGQVVNIISRKTSELEGNKIFFNQENTRLASAISNSEKSFSPYKESSSFIEAKKNVSMQTLFLNKTTDFNNEPKMKANSDMHSVCLLTAENLNHFDKSTKIDLTIKSKIESPTSNISVSSIISSDHLNSNVKQIEADLKNNYLIKDKIENEEQIRSSLTEKSSSTISQIFDLQNIKTSEHFNNSTGNGKTKKKVSFNDNLIQIHLIPNLQKFLNIEKCKSSEKQDPLNSMDEALSGINSPDKEFDLLDDSNLLMDNQELTHQQLTSLPKPKFIKTNLTQINSDQTIASGLKKNTRKNNNFNNHHLQVVKLTVNSANTTPNDAKNQQSFLTLIGSNKFAQKPNQVISKRDYLNSVNKSYHPQLFSQKRSNTFHNEAIESPPEKIDQSKVTNSIDSFSQSKYLSNDLTNIKILRNESPKKTLKTPNNSVECSVLLKNSAEKSPEFHNENEIQFNSIKNLHKQKKYVFLKQDDNLIREPSFIKNNNLITDKNCTNSFNSMSEFGSDLNQHPNIYKTGFEIKNISNGNNKSQVLNSVNQLIALRDINYYLTNNAKSNLKSLKNFGYQPSAEDTNKSGIKTNSHLKNIDNFDLRRTNSALPLLRNLNKNNNNADNATNLATIRVFTQTNGYTDSPKASIKNQFKIINSKIDNSFSRAKTFVYNQNLTSTTQTQKKRGNYYEKTTF
ncbi:unnamed protein product [Brachionus calyciflorus]|uniref:Uncharacterized protein n=1 Tax=Brachionus calyciflorus TaxID=104777 RepID=A0A813N9Q2_9BILA|nr:unnamed protein product [Brachionus calyciflorus]